MRIIGALSLLIGLTLVLIGLLMSRLVESYFGSATSTNAFTQHEVDTILGGYALSVVCAGIVAAAFGALAAAVPLRVISSIHSLPGLGQTLEARHVCWVFCALCCLASLSFGLLVTQSGTGISPDSIDYVRTAERLHNGDGFGTFNHYPLYPLLIAGSMHLGFGAEFAARLVPVLSFALLMIPLFFLAKAAHGTSAGYLTCTACVALTPLLYLTSNAWTDMLYVSLSVCAVLFLTYYARSEGIGTRVLCVAACFAAAATLASAAGLGLVLAGCVVAVVKNRSRPRVATYHAALFGIISFLPELVWLYRNSIATSGAAAGFDPLRETATASLIAMLNWIVVQTPVGFLVYFRTFALEESTLYRAGGILVGATSLILLGISIVRYRGALMRIINKNLASICYVFIFLAGLTAGSMLWFIQHEDRYIYCLYPVIVALAVSIFLHTYDRTKASPMKPALFLMGVVLFISFCVIQVVNSLSFYQVVKDGQNLNSPIWKNSLAIAWVSENAAPEQTIYANCPWALQWWTRNPIGTVPISNDQEGIEEFFETLEQHEDSLVVGFEGGMYQPGSSRYFLTRKEIAEEAQEHGLLLAVADFPEATIWRVRQ